MIDYDRLVRETKETCLEYLPKLMHAAGKLANAYTSGHLQDTDLFVPLINGLEWLTQAMSGMRMDIRSMEALLSRMERSLLQEDFVNLADQLDYELTDQLQAIYQQFQKDLSGDAKDS